MPPHILGWRSNIICLSDLKSDVFFTALVLYLPITANDGLEFVKCSFSGG